MTDKPKKTEEELEEEWEAFIRSAPNYDPNHIPPPGVKAAWRRLKTLDYPPAAQNEPEPRSRRGLTWLLVALGLAGILVAVAWYMERIP